MFFSFCFVQKENFFQRLIYNLLFCFAIDSCCFGTEKCECEENEIKYGTWIPDEETKTDTVLATSGGKRPKHKMQSEQQQLNVLCCNRIFKTKRENNEKHLRWKESNRNYYDDISFTVYLFFFNLFLVLTDLNSHCSVLILRFLCAWLFLFVVCCFPLKIEQKHLLKVAQHT